MRLSYNSNSLLIQKRIFDNVSNSKSYNFIIKSDLQNNFELNKKVEILYIKDNLELQQLRGIIDFTALLVKYNDYNITEKFIKDNKITASNNLNLFLFFVNLRIVKIGYDLFEGIRQNLYNYLTENKNEIFFNHDMQDNILVNIVEQSLLNELSFINDGIMQDLINKLKNNYYDESEYYRFCLQIIQYWREKNITSKVKQEKQIKQKDNTIKDLELNYYDSESGKNHTTSILKSNEALSNLPFEEEQIRHNNHAEKKTYNKKLLTALIDRKNEDKKQIDGYRIFTKQYDEIIKAKKLLSAGELYLINNLKLANDRKISIKARKIYRNLKNYDDSLKQENGSIHHKLDRKKLINKIINPLYQDIYLSHKKRTLLSDFIVTILIDNSGSMVGRPIEIMANTTDLLVKILEKLNIKNEIIGFTTKHWHGGESKNLWIKQGKPNNAGRLNDIRHIIYKEKNQIWRNSRKYLSLMLKKSIMKENIDGEALIWASRRLKSYQEKKKILIIISDGMPVDDVTLANNGKNYLVNHLQDIIKNIENKDNINLISVSTSKEVGNLYQNHITINDFTEISNKLIDILPTLIYN